ncbi:MAG: hypothetical protein L0F96_02565 [Lactococcus lactis]|nr:hypothetical protein [Lactococcus lactis]MDN5446587.1 hypothetical protein [Lactococcus lactis]MDN5473944.1 hypothetical protein [Lactococcus lactis]
MDNAEAIFSTRMENLILNRFEELLEKAVAARLKETDVVTQQEVLKKYKLSRTTLKKWEDEGLNRFEPPYEDTRCIYYLESEIERFLGMK